MVTPLSKLIFHIDNGASPRLKGTGLAAEYHLKSGEITWRKLGKPQVSHQRGLVSNINNYLWISSPLIIVPLLTFLGNYTKFSATPTERMGVMGLIVPFIFGVLLFLAFETLMILLRETYPLTEIPSVEIQEAYFESIYETTIKSNEAWGNVKIPYLTNIIVFTFVCGLVTPLMFWIYLLPGTFGEFLAKLGVLSFLISIIPNMLWNVIFKNFVYNKVIKNLKIKLENINHAEQ